MRIRIEGHQLPGREVCGQHDVHVGLQVGRDPVDLVPADAPAAVWEAEVRVVDGDCRGPAIHGARGDRFLYLTWGAGHGKQFTMFRRAKLMLDRVEGGLVARAAAGGGTLVASVHLTDDLGHPRCARVDPPAITWRVD